MSYHSVMKLPPKVAAEYAERAKNGESHHVSGQCYNFIGNNNQLVVLVRLDPPRGYVEKLTQKEADKLRREIVASNGGGVT